MPLEIENEHTFRRHLNTGLNVFVGAGFSTLATDSNGCTLPLTADLKKEVCDNILDGKYHALDPDRVFTIAKSQKEDELKSYFVRRFSVDKYDIIYNNLLSVNVKSIITTNVDDLLFNIFSQSDSHFLNDIYLHGAVPMGRSSVDYVPLHGCVRHPDKDFYFGVTELARAFASDPDRFHFLTERLQSAPTIFMGYSLRDPGVLQSLDPEEIGHRDSAPRWILLRPDEKGAVPSDEVEYFRSLGCQIITGECRELLEYFGKNNDYVISSEGKDNGIAEAFPELLPPDPNDIPVHSIEDFFHGFPPHWYNIYYSNIVRTSYFQRLLNAINGDKSVIVLGLAGSGKTTLIMQLIAELRRDRSVLLSEYLTEEAVEFLVKKSSDNKYVVVLENFSDYVREMLKLNESENFQVICTDRQFNYEMCSHFIDRRKFEIFDISELPENDQRSIFRSIPEGLRRTGYRRQKLQKGLCRRHSKLLILILGTGWFRTDIEMQYETSLKPIDAFTIFW